MKRSRNIILSTLVLLLILTGCSKEVTENTEDYKETLTFSNLVDLASQEEVRGAMESAEIPTESIDFFFQDVNNFNSIIEETSLVESGFTTIDSLEPDYDFVKILEMWDAKNPEFIGYNCRIIS